MNSIVAHATRGDFGIGFGGREKQNKQERRGYALQFLEGISRHETAPFAISQPKVIWKGNFTVPDYFTAGDSCRATMRMRSRQKPMGLIRSPICCSMSATA
jgi:hypothetical protein